MIDYDRFWAGSDDGMGTVEGVTDEDVGDWEEANGVKLPGPLREAFRRRDGGSIRTTDLLIVPLGDIAPVDEDFWASDSFPDGEADDPSLVFRVGYLDESSGQILLNYNAEGPGGEPSVYLYYNDGTGVSRVGETVDGFLEAYLATTPVPLVDWSGSEEGIEIIAREGFDVRYEDAGRARVEQVLGRLGEALVLYVREEIGDGAVRLEKTFLPGRLDPRVTGVKRTRPGPPPTFGLDLHPEEMEGIVNEVSERVDDPGDPAWKNATNRGGPAYVTFESPDRAGLEALRTRLLGKRAEIGYIFEGMMG